MDKQFLQLLQLGKRGAERRCRALMNELAVLFASFPHLTDAFDADELPISFIIKRDAHDARADGVSRHKSARAASTRVVGRRLSKVDTDCGRRD